MQHKSVLSPKNHIEMPICEQINALLEGKISAQQAAHNLMSRPSRKE